jgi:hypothetical protein
MRTCSACRVEIEERFRFCPWCGGPQRLKIVDFFLAHAGIERDRGKALRVSRYLGHSEDERHVRFSVWHEAGQATRAEAAVSLDEVEASRLARFLTDPAGVPEETEAPLR